VTSLLETMMLFTRCRFYLYCNMIIWTYTCIRWW